MANINRSRASGATSVVWRTRETIPASPKKRYMVECCQFMISSHCFSAELYNWSLGPSANCSARIPGVQSTCCCWATLAVGSWIPAANGPIWCLRQHRSTHSFNQADQICLCASSTYQRGRRRLQRSSPSSPAGAARLCWPVGWSPCSCSCGSRARASVSPSTRVQLAGRSFRGVHDPWSFPWLSCGKGSAKKTFHCKMLIGQQVTLGHNKRPLMCSLITPHDATDGAGLREAATNVHFSTISSPKALQGIWQQIQLASQPQTTCNHGIFGFVPQWWSPAKKLTSSSALRFYPPPTSAAAPEPHFFRHF